MKSKYYVIDNQDLMKEWYWENNNNSQKHYAVA